MIYIGGTLNKEELIWSIVGNIKGNSPKILSELRFRDIYPMGCYATSRYNIYKRIIIGLNFSNSKIFKWRVNNSDYKEDHDRIPAGESKILGKEMRGLSIKRSLSQRQRK